MNKEDCKAGTLVRARNGRSVGKIVEVNGETGTLSVAVVPLDRHGSAIWHEPGQLACLGDLPTRTFCVGGKVRYVPRGRSKYLYAPKKDKIYDVVARESESGQAGISGHGFNDGINWYWPGTCRTRRQASLLCGNRPCPQKKRWKMRGCFSL